MLRYLTFNNILVGCCVSLSEGKPVFMYQDWFLSSSPEFRQIVWIFSIERPEPMEQYVNMNLTWRSGQRGEERRDDKVGRLSLLTGDCPDCHLNQLWFGINLCSPPIGQQARTALAEASHWLRPAVICNQFLSRISMDLAWSGLSNDGAMLDFFFHLWTRSGAGKLNGEWILFFFVDLESGLASLASDLESLLS